MTYRTSTRTGRTTAKTRVVVLTKGQIKQLQNTRKLIMQLHNNLQTGIRKLAKKTITRNQALLTLAGINKLTNQFANKGLRTLKKVTKTANGRRGH